MKSDKVELPKETLSKETLSNISSKEEHKYVIKNCTKRLYCIWSKNELIPLHKEGIIVSVTSNKRPYYNFLKGEKIVKINKDLYKISFGDFSLTPDEIKVLLPKEDGVIYLVHFEMAFQLSLAGRFDFMIPAIYKKIDDDKYKLDAVMLAEDFVENLIKQTELIKIYFQNFKKV